MTPTILNFFLYVIKQYYCINLTYFEKNYNHTFDPFAATKTV